jgi:hypothetical protein
MSDCIGIFPLVSEFKIYDLLQFLISNILIKKKFVIHIFNFNFIFFRIKNRETTHTQLIHMWFRINKRYFLKFDLLSVKYNEYLRV